MSGQPTLVACLLGAFVVCCIGFGFAIGCLYADASRPEEPDYYQERYDR